MSECKLSRRGLLKGMGSLGLAATVPSSMRALADADTRTKPQAIPLVVEPFALSDVELLDSPFFQARKRCQAYLLSLDANRMLHTFRINAGLQAKAAVYGGWESNPTWTDIHCQGHTLGHYLSACSLMYAATQDPRFKRRADYIVAELNACQTATRSGLITAFPEGNSLMQVVLSGSKYTGVPWYTLHKVYAGLRDAALYTANPVAKEVFLRFCDWAVTATAPLFDAQFQAMLQEEHGGMNEVLTDAYVMTGDTRYLLTAQRFCHQAILEPLANSRDHLDGLHANTQIPKVIGFERLYQQTGQQNYGTAAVFFWKTVAHTRSFVNGNHGDEEHFFPVSDFSKHVFSAKASETCCDYNMLKLTRMLFQQDPSCDYADFYERALYNDILASQDPDTGMVTYFQGNKPGYRKLYCTPTESFWCCTGSGMENHSKYNDSIYFRSPAATAVKQSVSVPDVLYVNLFIPSVVHLSPDASITQTTRFPGSPSSRFAWKSAAPTEMTLKLRHPGWCQRATVAVNHKPVIVSNQPGRFIELKRTWQSGDVVDLQLPMHLRAVPLPGNDRIIAFVYGPVVLAGDFGIGGIAAGADLNRNERLYGAVLNTPFTPPTLTGDADSLVAQATPGPTPLSFYLPATGDAGSTMSNPTPSQTISLVAYYSISHQRYATYWPLAPDPNTTT